MNTSTSIRVRLSRSYYIFFLLVVLLGGISVGMISYENDLSSQIRDRWLQDTRLIGDFENFTSDYRADEGSILLSSTPEELKALENDLTTLDHSITTTRQGFNLIPHDVNEQKLYEQFNHQWTTYKAAQSKVTHAFKAGLDENAVLLFQTESKAAYSEVSSTLEALRKYNINEVTIVSRQSEKIHFDVLWLIGLAVVMTNILAVLSSLYVKRDIFNPLIDLISAMRKLAHNDKDIAIEGLEREDEIGEMARAIISFRGNMITLADSQEKLEQQAIVLLENLEEEQKVAIHQRNFVSMASHEFRTPLNVIDGQAQRLLRHKNNTDSVEIETRAKAIRASVLRMTNLIDSLLEVGRLVDGDATLYLQITEFDMAALLHDVCHQYQEISPHTAIYEDFSNNKLICKADFKLMFQVVGNLIGNSIKYSNTKAIVRVDAKQVDDTIVISVKDNGIGIPPEDLPNLFTRHYRGSNVSAIVGTGLGMFLVKSVVDRHGGSVRVESKLKVGTMVTITIPKDATQASGPELLNEGTESRPAEL